jgi:hypothetical protein
MEQRTEGTQHYRAFIAQLENKGADLSHVKVGKSVLVRGFLNA